MTDGMSEICIDCVHQEVCRYDCHRPSEHCNDKAVADDFIPQDEWVEFARWVAKEVLDNYFEESSGAFAEIACRKLVKLGLVEVKDNVYKRKGGAEE